MFLAEKAHFVITEYVDKDDNLVRTEIKIEATSWWSSDTASLQPEHTALRITFDPETDTLAVRGNISNIHNIGPVLIDSGRRVVEAAGGFMRFEDFGPLCEALS